MIDPAVPDRSWDAARRLVMQHGWNAAGYQLLNPGMRLWFSTSGDAVAGYVSFNRVRIIAGAPVCERERLAGVVEELEAETRANGERLMFFGAGARLQRLYAARADYCTISLGAQPSWEPHRWSELVRHAPSLRAQLHRARNKEVCVSEWAPARARHAGALRAVLREWLARRGMPPLSFMATPDLLGGAGEHADDHRVFVAERGREIVGFLLATPIPAREGWLVEQWPRTAAAPNGTTHLLVDTAMRAFAASGSRYATLGLSPLSHHGARPGVAEPAWLRFVWRWLRAHGRRFYNFGGLEAFKTSLRPMTWEPLCAIAQGKSFTPEMLRAVAGAFCGGSPEKFVARAVGSAAMQELRTARTRLVRWRQD